eukprot:3278238-Pyramimonas_sp.AAC.1
MSRAAGASEVPKPCGDGPCGEVVVDFEVTAGSVTTVLGPPAIPLPAPQRSSRFGLPAPALHSGT